MPLGERTVSAGAGAWACLVCTPMSFSLSDLQPWYMGWNSDMMTPIWLATTQDMFPSMSEMKRTRCARKRLTSSTMCARTSWFCASTSASPMLSESRPQNCIFADERRASHGLCKNGGV